MTTCVGAFKRMLAANDYPGFFYSPTDAAARVILSVDHFTIQIARIPSTIIAELKAIFVMNSGDIAKM